MDQIYHLGFKCLACICSWYEPPFVSTPEPAIPHPFPNSSLTLMDSYYENSLCWCFRRTFVKWFWILVHFFFIVFMVSHAFLLDQQATSWNAILFRNPAFFFCLVCNMSNTQDRVWRHFETPRKEVNIRRVAEYFWRTSRCLELWSNTALSVWLIFSIETKTKEKTEK